MHHRLGKINRTNQIRILMSCCPWSPAWFFQGACFWKKVDDLLVVALKTQGLTVTMNVDHGGRGISPPEFGEGDTNANCPPQILSYRYKKERSMAFKMCQDWHPVHATSFRRYVLRKRPNIIYLRLLHCTCWIRCFIALAFCQFISTTRCVCALTNKTTFLS